MYTCRSLVLWNFLVGQCGFGCLEMRRSQKYNNAQRSLMHCGFESRLKGRIEKMDEIMDSRDRHRRDPNRVLLSPPT